MIEIFTDGGCRMKSCVGAWSFVAVYDGNVIFTASHAQENTTNNEMELTAILEALRYASGNQFAVTIYSDSQYSVNTLNIWYDRWRKTCTLHDKKNIPLIEKIMALKGSARLIWVKGHADNQFNNLSDRLVNEAMDSFGK